MENVQESKATANLDIFDQRHDQGAGYAQVQISSASFNNPYQVDMRVAPMSLMDDQPWLAGTFATPHFSRTPADCRASPTASWHLTMHEDFCRKPQVSQADRPYFNLANVISEWRTNSNHIEAPNSFHRNNQAQDMICSIQQDDSELTADCFMENDLLSSKVDILRRSPCSSEQIGAHVGDLSIQQRKSPFFREHSSSTCESFSAQNTPICLVQIEPTQDDAYFRGELPPRVASRTISLTENTNRKL